MKKAFFVGLLIFSLLVNISVGVVIARHWWHVQKRTVINLTECPALSSDDVQKISSTWSGPAKLGIMQTRRELLSKKAEVLDLIAANPGDLKPAENAIREMINLRSSLEQKTLDRISHTMASLEPEKRMAFLEFLKNRTCTMKGPGKGFGKRGGPGCCPPDEGARTGPGM